MMWRTHVTGGIAILWVLVPVALGAKPEAFPLSCAAAALGALLPDLDAAESKIRSLGVYHIYPFVPLAAHFNREYGHRGALHSPYGLLGCGLMALVLGVSGAGLPALALWLGYMSHLLLDACTKTGIPFPPFRKRLFLLPKPLRVVTGSPDEEIVFALTALTALGLALHLLAIVSSLHPFS